MSTRQLFLCATSSLVLALGAIVYAADSHVGKVVSVTDPSGTSDGKLVMTDEDGKKEHSHRITSKAKITRDGKTISLSELKKGDVITVSTNDDGKISEVATGDKSSVAQTDSGKDRLPDFVKSLNLSSEQEQKIKSICRECDGTREQAWKKFSNSYREAIGIEASMLAAMEEGLSDNQRKQLREQRQRMSRDRAASNTPDDARSAKADDKTSRTVNDRGGVVDEVLIVGISLSPDQESASEKVRDSYVERLGTLSSRIEQLHARLVALETERLLKIEDILSKEQRDQLRKLHQQLGTGERISAGNRSGAQ